MNKFKYILLVFILSLSSPSFSSDDKDKKIIDNIEFLNCERIIKKGIEQCNVKSNVSKILSLSNPVLRYPDNDIAVASQDICKASAIKRGQKICSEANEFIVFDGDSAKGLVYGREKLNLRLAGIDAPELNQKCKNDLGVWECGIQAKNELMNYLNENIRCNSIGKDRYNRTLVECETEYEGKWRDISELMVLNGYALAYREYSEKYIEFEKIAKSQKKGIWSGKFDKPWDWRKKNN